MNTKFANHPNFGKANIRVRISIMVRELSRVRTFVQALLSTKHSRCNQSHCLNEFWEKRETSPILICCMLSMDASGTILRTSLVWRGWGSKPRPPAHVADAIPLSYRCSIHQLLTCGANNKFWSLQPVSVHSVPSMSSMACRRCTRSSSSSSSRSLATPTHAPSPSQYSINLHTNNTELHNLTVLDKPGHQ